MRFSVPPTSPRPCLLHARVVPPPLQTHSGKLQAVLDIVLSHQGAPLKSELMQRLMSALVLPAPEHYRALLRRLAALSGAAPLLPPRQVQFLPAPRHPSMRTPGARPRSESAH